MIIIVTKKGMIERFEESSIRITGRASKGVTGIKLGEGDEVVGIISEPKKIQKEQPVNSGCLNSNENLGVENG